MNRKSDADVRADVLLELGRNSDLSGADIDVSLEGGVVTLMGTVDTWVARQAAQDAAHRVASVRDVVNDISVKLAPDSLRDDAEIARAVRDTLEWEVLVPDERILSTVSKGVVTLEGEVPERVQSERAEKAVLQIAGVGSVLNRIRIIPPAPDVCRLRALVRTALEREAEQRANAIALDVEGHRVAVSGRVYSLRERDAVVAAVRGASGVATVNDHLRIEPYA
jgi:osmotically-inducible protein OsmY